MGLLNILEKRVHLLPAQATIGFEPQITMTLNNSQYSSFKETWQSQTTGGIGPFYFGGGPIKTYGEKNSVTCNDDRQTVSIGPIKSTLPLLLGVISTKL
jgi:hypothetical protein